jgi:hypothetical protein
MIDPRVVPRRSPHVHTAVLDDDAVLYDDRTHATLRLNVSGRAIWERIDGSTSVEEIVRLLAQAHQVSSADIAPDVHLVVQRLVTDGAVLTEPAEPSG